MLNNIASYRDIIDKIPLFSGINNDLENLLKSSHIQQYKKGELLFLEGEKANNFYIILSGWLKLFKSNDDGEELILKMAGIGFGTALNTVLLNEIFMHNAQIIEDSTLLIIPVSSLKNLLQENHQLAKNFMLAAAKYSEELSSHLEKLALKSAEEKVSWFLLNLFVESGKTLNKIELPYDKALISSYLGMKPETFSRSLHKLKEAGIISVEKNIITLSDRFVLCDHCDLNLALKCKFHDSEECPNPQL